MKVLLFRSNNIFDSRVNKYHNYYERACINYIIVGWDRKREGWKKDHYDFFYQKAGEGEGGLKALKKHFLWMRFVYRYLKHHSDVTTIHACDLNAAFPAALFKCWHNRHVNLIFDACDWYSSNFVGNKLLSFLFDKMERFTYRWADQLIICEPEREAQIQFQLRVKPLVMPNIPELNLNQITEVQDKFRFNNDKPTIAYMGFFGDSRFLMEILKLAETEPFNLLIAGYGYKPIVDKCNELRGWNNVKYFGRVNMEDGLNMENAADAIYAMYCKNIPNHIFAAPNKYYEALLLGKPLITTKGTLPGNKVEHFDTGWTINEDIEELRALIRRLTKEEMTTKGGKAKELWESTFKEYLPNFFKESYAKILR